MRAPAKLALMSVCLLAAVPLAATAQERHGFWFNGGLGYGSLGCEDCGSREGGLSGGLSLGGTLSPHLLLGVGTTGWYKEESGVSLTTGTLDARLRLYPSSTGGFFLTGGFGIGRISVDAGGFGSASETGPGLMLGLGYDIRVGNSLSLTPFWNGFAVRTSNSDANVGQLGLSLTVHKFRKAAAVPARYPETRPVVVPVAEPIPADGYRPATPPPSSEPIVSPEPAAAPLEADPDAGRTALPAGTNYVGDVRLRVYYPIGCAAQHAIPTQFQVFFQSSGGAERDGFKPSGDC